MEWKNISELLGKVSGLFQVNFLFKKAAADAILAILKIQVQESDISMKNGVVYIKAPPLVKGEIFLKKQSILNLINNKGLPNQITDLK
jgi:hypothetical protein